MQREGEPMDEYDASRPYDAPTTPGGPPAEAPVAPSIAPEPRRRRSRLVAAGTAVALVVAAGGAGFALGHHHDGRDSAGGQSGGGYTFGQFPNHGEGGTAPFGGAPFS